MYGDWTFNTVLTVTVSLLPRHLGFLDGIMKTLETVLAFGFHHVGDPGVLFIMERFYWRFQGPTRTGFGSSRQRYRYPFGWIA
jgi:hypothetical protein